VHRSTRRRLAACALAAAGLIAAVVFARLTPPLTTTADLAITELYTSVAAQGRLLVGPYSRFGWHHPGPLYFYLQAPVYALAGSAAAALFAGALALNLASFAILVWTLAREDKGALAALVPAAVLAFAWREPRLLASPWTAHVPVLPSIAFVVLCAAAAGRRPQ
jgi:4-amino-4-deoxy-L-arabinose transferase-like glycosyltransferase